MSAYGAFQVRPNVLSDKSITYDIIWRSSSAPFEYALIYLALDEHDAKMRCEKLNAALQE